MVTAYEEMPISAEARKALKPGKNVLAVHCHQNDGSQYIDVGIVAVKGSLGRLALAQIASDRKRFAFATELWAAALASDPKLGDDRQAQHRYNAARAAVLAAAGQSQNEPPPDDAAKAKLRGQALDWLKAELTAWTKLLESGPEYRPFVARALVTWQSDTALAGIRDDAALKKLPADEQKAFAQLWGDVAAALQKCKVKVEIIKAEYGADGKWNDVTEVLRKHATDLPLITLPSLDAAFPYNASFGDPAHHHSETVEGPLQDRRQARRSRPARERPDHTPHGQRRARGARVAAAPPLHGRRRQADRGMAGGAAGRGGAARQLKKLNPDFAGKFEAVVEKDQVVGLDLTSDGLTDLSPVRAFAGMQRLTCAGLTNGALADLGPLRGLPLRVLEVHGNPDLTDLTPLAGMKLELLNLWGWGGSDLAPLKGMPLKWLNCSGSKQKLDLAPLAGAPLEGADRPHDARI